MRIMQIEFLHRLRPGVPRFKALDSGDGLSLESRAARGTSVLFSELKGGVSGVWTGFCSGTRDQLPGGLMTLSRRYRDPEKQ